MQDVLTVLVQTSPIPSHPSTALIEALFRSFRKVDGLLEARIVVLADGCEEINVIDGENENVKHGKASPETATNYREFLQRLEDLIATQAPPFCPLGDGRVSLLRLETRHGAAPAIRVAMERVVSTPLVMVCQHDNFFVNYAPLRQVSEALVKTPGLGIGATCIHFLSTATLGYQQKVKRRYGLDLPPVHVEDLEHPLVPLAFWYGRSHLTTADYMRDYALNRALPIGSHLEELLGEKQLHDIVSRGPQAHRAYGTYVLDQGVEILYHVSGRRARRAPTEEQNPHTQKQVKVEGPSINGIIHPNLQLPLKGAFTTARSCQAMIPGLVFPSDKVSNSQQSKKFKGRCFRCNERGHSKMHCPLTILDDDANAEVIDLS